MLNHVFGVDDLIGLVSVVVISWRVGVDLYSLHIYGHVPIGSIGYAASRADIPRRGDMDSATLASEVLAITALLHCHDQSDPFSGIYNFSTNAALCVLKFRDVLRIVQGH